MLYGKRMIPGPRTGKKSNTVIVAAVIVLSVSGLTGSEEFVDAVNSSFIVSSVKGILTQISGY